MTTGERDEPEVTRDVTADADPRQLELAAEGGVFVVHDPGPTARDEIRRLRDLGYGYSAIARALNTNGVPTPSGRGRWSDQQVRHHLNPQEWAAYIAEHRRRRRGGD